MITADYPEGNYYRMNPVTQENELSPFTSTAVGIYWTVLLMTTTGSAGSLEPYSDAGRAVANIVVLIGVVCIAIPMGVIGENFSIQFKLMNEEKTRRELRKKINDEIDMKIITDSNEKEGKDTITLEGALVSPSTGAITGNDPNSSDARFIYRSSKAVELILSKLENEQAEIKAKQENIAFLIGELKKELTSEVPSVQDSNAFTWTLWPTL